MKRKNVLLLTATLLAGSAWAQSAADRVDVRAPWIRAVPPSAQVTGAFLVLKNNGPRDVQLVKAESAAAKTVELHAHSSEGGVMKMRRVSGIAVKAGSETALAPGGYHIMLIDLNAALKEGDKVPLRLGFDDGSSKQIEAPVTRTPAGEGHRH